MEAQAGQSFFAILAALLFAALVAAAGSQHGATIAGLPLFAACGVLCFAIQWLAYVPAYLKQTEHYYDLIGSVTYLAVSGLAAFASGLQAIDLLLLTLIAIWAVRLGSFLFRRVRAAGEDIRFANLKTRPMRFLMTWTLQGLWVFVTLAAALAAITNAQPPDALGWPALIGTAIWALGFAVEVVADRQKARFRADPANQARFITNGLWGWCQHPNYFGEILLWTGIAVIALPYLSGWQLLTLVSPVFVWLLLTKISGIPLLQANAKKRWGQDAEYQAYRAQTPLLIPRPPAI